MKTSFCLKQLEDVIFVLLFFRLQDGDTLHSLATVLKLAYYRTVHYLCSCAQVLARDSSRTELYCGFSGLNK